MTAKNNVKESVRRGKGRPARGAPSVGRDAVIAAARQLLKKMPPSRISRADLSREAGIDPGLVRYYFGDLSSLLTEVVLQIFEDLQVRRMTSDAMVPFRDKLKRRIVALCEVLQENPHLHEMLLQRAVFGSNAASNEIDSIRREYTFNSRDSLAALIEEGVRKGECRRINVEYLYVAVIGMCEFSVTGYPLFELLQGETRPRNEVMAEYAEFLTDLIIRGVEPRRGT